MVVVKKINNNVVTCRDNNQRELIAFGRGIGFPPTPYELSSNLVLTLADHIAFAMERAKRGLYLPMPSIYEMEISRPAEVQVGRQFVAEIARTFKVRMPKGEIQCIASHFVNARYALQEDTGSQLEQRYEKILEQTRQELYQACHHELVASTLATELAHEMMPGAQVGCMILSMPVYPLTPNPDDVMVCIATEHQNDFFGDVHVRGTYPGYMLRYFRENGLGAVDQLES